MDACQVRAPEQKGNALTGVGDGGLPGRVITMVSSEDQAIAGEKEAGELGE
jgi:hypothetical protein